MSETRTEANSNADAAHMLETVLHRENWTPDLRDAVAEYLRRVVVDQGGDYAKKRN